MQRITACFVLVLVALTAPAVNARHATGDHLVVHVEGVVSSISGDLITILEGRITIDVGAAHVTRFGERGERREAEISLGDRIVATSFDSATTGTLLAHIVVIITPPDGRLVGTVQRIDSARGTLVVLGQTIEGTEKTRFESSQRGRTIASLDDLVPGDPVTVAVDVEGAALQARAVHLLPLQQERIAGVVKSIGREVWVITSRAGDTAVYVTEATRIEGEPAPGDQVEAAGTRDSAGNFVADWIRKVVREPVAHPSVVRFDGRVEAIRGDRWIVGGRDVQVQRGTTITGNPVVGDGVRVIGTQRGDLVLARSIEKL
jgi:hypothetical protein